MKIEFDPSNPADCAMVANLFGSAAPAPAATTAPVPAPAPGAPAPAPAPAPGAPAPAPAPAPAATATAAELGAAVQAYATAHGPKAAKAKLTELGFAKAGDVPDASRSVVIAAMAV
jgi:hypothetical protein